MRDFIGMERFANDQYAKRLDHFFHALGCEISPEMFAPPAEGGPGAAPYAKLSALSDTE